MIARKLFGSLRDLAERSCDRRTVYYSTYDASNALFMLADARALGRRIDEERRAPFPVDGKEGIQCPGDHFLADCIDYLTKE